MIGCFSKKFMKCLDPSSVQLSSKSHLIGLQIYFGKRCHALLMNCSKAQITTSMNYLGGIGIAWIMLSGYPGLHTWLSTQDMCGGYHLGVHLWMATQEQRD
jgi:hypothetical protein